MLLRLIKEKIKSKGSLCYQGTCISWDQWIAWVEELKAAYGSLADKQVGLISESPIATVAAITAFNDMDGNILLLPKDLRVTKVEQFQNYSIDFILHVTSDLRTSLEYCPQRYSLRGISGGSVTIFSSGTTSIPHPQRWSWSTLLRRATIPKSAFGGAWLCAYSMETFAGVQSFLYGCVGAETLIFLNPVDALCDILQFASHFTLGMATPTFWRRALLQESKNKLRNIVFETISMGGEIVAQELLDNLYSVFRTSRLVHVYASSEHGSIFSVSDGRAGFPSAWLGRTLTSGASLAVRDNELFVSLYPGGEYLPTGDLICLGGDRIFFDGRSVEQINVGGRKVNPTRIDAALRCIEGVVDLRVYGLESPITGQVVGVDFVLQTGYSEAEVKLTVNKYFLDNFTSYERPRKVRFLKELPITQAGKATRR